MRWSLSLQRTVSMRDVKVAQMKILKTLITSPTKTWRVMKSSESSDSDSCDSSDLETEPHSSHMDTGQPKAAIKGQKFSWRKKTLETPDTTFKGPCAKPPDEIHTPLEYFKNFITDDMLLLLMEQTNLYSVQKSNHLRNVNTTVKELQILIGLYLRMGLCQMPRNRAYWENDTRCPMVADNMSHNRFQTLLGSLHFTANTDLLHRDAEDKCWKIRPWLEMFRKQCLDIVPEEYNSVDEQMVPFKGTHSPIRQYVKGKPHTWGLKIWARCSSSGMLHDFVVYQGGTGKKTLLGIGDVVVKLCETLPAEQNYKVFADNFFSLAPLVLTLLQRQIYFGRNTLWKFLAQRGRGSVDAMVNKEESMVIVKWYDNKSVTLISSYCATEPQDTVHRWSKSGKAFVEVKRPLIVKEYNTFMGGIDLLDTCIARYKYHMKSRRWYLYLFWQTIMLGVVNAWLIYRQHWADFFFFFQEHQARWFSHRSNRLDTTMRQHKVLSEKDKKKNCKKGFLCSRSTTHRRHCIPGFYIKALEVSFVLCVYLLLAVNNCVKNAFNEYSKVRCALGMQRERCDPFLHSVSVLLYSCAILQGCECQGMKRRDDGR
uniref:PiggyBac transposable element-derived protein domain-containing protein n=1 Tax=Neolamprologus brichardi TaxID=32507 RepID=A0A3Q4GCX2_NEOBR